MPVRQARNLKILLTVVLISITLFSFFKYLLILKEKYALLKNLDEAKGQVAALELEKQDLSQTIDQEKELQKALTEENLTLKDELKANTDKLTQLDTDLLNAQKSIEQLTTQIALAKAENTAIREERDNLALGLTQVSQERDTLKAGLNSLPELKKRIKEVKLEIRKAKAVVREITKERRVIEGNRGFLVKNGESTYPITKIKIEVMPVPPGK